MQRIIDGVLYDTQKSDFIASRVFIKYKKIKQKNSMHTNFYIAKDGVIFQTNRGDIEISDEEDIIELKRIMDPEIYVKYFPLVIPGEGVYPESKTKKGKIMKTKTRLDTVE